MSAIDELQISSDDAGVAALNLVNALFVQLIRDKTISGDEANFVAAIASSMSRAQDNEHAAMLIETILPSAKKVDVKVEAMKQGYWIKRESSK